MKKIETAVGQEKVVVVEAETVRQALAELEAEIILVCGREKSDGTHIWARDTETGEELSYDIEIVCDDEDDTAVDFAYDAQA